MSDSFRAAARCLLVLLALVGSAGAETLTVLSDQLDPDRLDALRTEAAIRGVRVEVIAATGSDSLAAALAERPGVTAVIWIDRETLRVRLPDGRQAHAPLGAKLSPRAVAAIASSVLDDLHAMPAIAITVDVRVEAPGMAAPAALGEARAEVRNEGPPKSWYFDVGGLAAPGGIYAAHGGFGHMIGKQSRASLLGHVARVPDATALGLTLEVSRTWGRRVRGEIGARAVAAVVLSERIGFCESFDCPMETTPEGGIGGGAFVGLGVGLSFGTVYLRAGADVMMFEHEDPMITPNGTLGLELPF